MKDQPSCRRQLIAFTIEFVEMANRIPGVIRIALIGSLTTTKDDPKDVDLLITVADEIDLTPLAKITRKLKGRAQSLNRGGEVFLADPNGNHIGRICPWKRCGPGIRRSCDALHCGQRHYLHDDLDTIRLSADLVATPPVELWPRQVAHVDIPSDLQDAIQKTLGPLIEHFA